jgi:hypothetical protein
MQLFSNILLISQLILFIIIIANATKLLTDYLLTKIK